MNITKTCKCCLVEKGLNCFYNSKNNRHGKTTFCKKCKDEYNKKYLVGYRKPYTSTKLASPEEFLKRIWQSIKHGRKSPGYENIKTLLKEEEFFDEKITKEFYRLFKVWDINNRPFFLTPSIDRINPDGNYEVGNIRWLSVRENARGARTTNQDKKRPVQMLDKQGKYIRTFSSIKLAASFVGAASGANICMCCRHTIKSAYGHVWKYVDKEKPVV